MGCIHSKQLLNEEDLDYIARNTAMDKAAVEVRIQPCDGNMQCPIIIQFRIFLKLSMIVDTIF